MGWEIKNPSTIYAIRCIENGKVYVGRTQNLERRMKEHLTELQKGRKRTNYGQGYESSDFQRDFNKHGEKAFEVYILENDVSPDAVREREAFWIAEYNATDRRYGYNKLGEQPTVGFCNFKSGLPPKMGTGNLSVLKFDLLTPSNKEVVQAMIDKLLAQQLGEEKE